MSSRNSSCDDNPAQPLMPKAVSSLKKNVRRFTSVTKVSVVVLVWQFSTGLVFNLFLRPINYIQSSYFRDGTLIAVYIYAVFIFSPLAGFIADVKFGRIKTLLCGTYILLFSVISILILGIPIASTVHDFNTFSIVLLTLLDISTAFYCIGNVVFLSNIVQFGTDQLRDVPTRYSVLFINAYFWTDSFSNLMTSITYWPGHDYIIDSRHDFIAFDKVRAVLMAIVLIFSILTSIAVLLLIHKKQSQWFLTEGTRENPYKLVYNVIKFAIRHKKIIRGSAFTYCEDEHLSRLDFGKQRYGGPYTTEQVENVKVALDILKVLLSLGPIFLLEGAAVSSFLYHPGKHDVTYYKVSTPL